MAAVMVAVIVCYEFAQRQWLYVFLGILVFLGCLFQTRGLVSPQGVDMAYLIFGRTIHNLWPWPEITAIWVDWNAEKNCAALHFSRGSVRRTLCLTIPDAKTVLNLSRERNPSIRISDLK